jgi:hypothetical protein
MKNKLQRYYGRKELHFITFSCYQRKPFLNSLRVKTVFIKILEEVRTAVSVLAGGVCADARACASVDRRICARDTIEGCAGFEAASVARDAAAKETKADLTTPASISARAKRANAILATTVLRFQGV